MSDDVYCLIILMVLFGVFYILDGRRFDFLDKRLEALEKDQESTNQDTTERKHHRYQKCPVCGRGYNLNYYRTNKLGKQGFVDIRCPGCDTLFRVKGDWNLPNWHTKLEHEVLIKGGDK